MILGTFFEARGSIFEASGRLGRPFGSPGRAGTTMSRFFSPFSALLRARCRPFGRQVPPPSAPERPKASKTKPKATPEATPEATSEATERRPRGNPEATLSSDPLERPSSDPLERPYRCAGCSVSCRTRYDVNASRVVYST